jgi:mannose-6-phosphate isomerase
LLIAEIQQTSDITYRIYDFDRVDDKGNKRELHTEEALLLSIINIILSIKPITKPQKTKLLNLVTCPYFTTNMLDFTEHHPTTRHLIRL